MNTLHMMIGIQGSGKSTYAKKLSVAIGCPIVSSDIIRTMHPNWEEKDIFPEVYRLAAEYLRNGQDVIADSTSITPRVRARYVENVKKYGVDFKVGAYYLEADINVCRERVLVRNTNPNERYLPIEIIDQYKENLIPPTMEEGFSFIKTIRNYNINDEVFDFQVNLLKKLVVDEYQGFAFFYNDGVNNIEQYQGYQNIDKLYKITEESNFRLASVSKQFIAYTITILIEKKLLKYDTLISSIYPELPDYFSNITIRNLLNHTSGIFDYEDMKHSEKQISDRDVFEFLKTTNGTYFPVGSKYQYSNTAYVLLGLIIEKISGINLGKYIEKEVFEKIGMTSSRVNYQGITGITNRAYGQAFYNNELVMADQYWCSATIGDGGLYSSIKDLKKWLEFISTTNYSNMLKDMFKSNILPDGKDSEYGYGMRVVNRNGNKIIYHCGETIGTNTIIGFVKEKNIKFIFLTNRSNINTAKFIDNLVELIK